MILPVEGTCPELRERVLDEREVRLVGTGPATANR